MCLYIKFLQGYLEWKHGTFETGLTEVIPFARQVANIYELLLWETVCFFLDAQSMK